MTFDAEQKMVANIRDYITENIPISQLADNELEEKVERITEQHLSGLYVPIEQRVSIVEQVYSSIRGFDLLDAIISDDTITEVMINGPQNVLLSERAAV